MKKTLATLTRYDIRSLEIADNKALCARQALRPNAIPPYAPKTAADKYFREALFAYADAEYLQEYFWRSLARQHNIAEEDMDKLYVDFNANELFLVDRDIGR
jgi:hypothetical protein